MATVSLAKLAISVVSDSKSAVKDLTGLEGTAKRLRKKFTTLEAGTISLTGALGVLAGAGGIAFAATQMFELGSAAEETQSKFSTTFQTASGDVQAFIDDFGTLAGLTRQQAQDITATTGAIAQGMGFATDASAEFAMQAVELAGDLTSFNDIPIAETARAIQAAVTGEREQLKRLGIVVREVDVQQRAMAMSGKDNLAAITQQEKAAATMALITERAGVAVGDLARTQDSAANRARQLGAQFGNLKESLAVALLPAMEVFLEELGMGVDDMGAFVDRVRDSGPTLAAWARVVVDSAKFVGQAFSLLIGGAFDLGQAIGNLGAAWFELAEGNIRAAIDRAKAAGGEFVQIKDRAMGMVDAFEAIQFSSGEAFETLAAGAGRAASEVQNLQVAMAGAGTGGGLTAAQQQLLAMNVEFRDMSHLLSFIPEQLVQVQENMEPVPRTLGAAAEQGNEFARVMADAATTSGLSFKRFASTVIREMQRIALKKAALKIFDFLAGGPLSSFAGLFDEGGRIPAGQVGIVGERGPELVRGPANVTGREDTAAMMSGSGGSTVNITLVAHDSGQVVDTVRYQTDRDEQKGREVRIPIRAGVVTR